MPTKSGRAAGGGLLLTIVSPLFYWTLAKLIEGGAVTVERTGVVFEALNSLGLSATVQLVLSIVGIRIVGTALGFRSAGPWIVIYGLGLPAVAFAWFIGFATFGGAIGSPF